jgi:hypothetical protein
MLHREDPAGLLVIGQPAHAWVSGQLARAWGNARFGEVAPWEEVCLGAEQHDNGWAAWEGAPTLNPRTGRPHTFIELPTLTHVGIWSPAAARVLPQSRYAALLVSLHGTGLYARHDYARDSPEEARMARDFLAQGHAFEERLLAALRDDPRYAPHATPEAVSRNRRLVGAWDGLSLALCMGLREPREFPNVPAAGDATTLTLTPVGGDPTEIAVAPWPFRPEAVTLVCEGRRLPETFAHEGAMRAALARAPWVTIETRLRPG